ncbi:MAG: rhodanese-like domain-containing protein [Ignavibacteriales bacterium]|nr:rhodanese-like domain-containing protein [Ignavibacteriales bacterium]
MTLNKILVSIAIILGAGAAIIGSPTRNNDDLSQIAKMIETERDHITPIELAVTMKEGKKKIRIIDLRDSVSFYSYHIPGARLMTLDELLNSEVKRNETVVLYSQGGTHASQAWVLLRMKKFDSVFTLLGGLTGWEQEILFPVIRPDASDDERKLLERKKELSIYFEGTPQIISKTPMKKNQPKKIVPLQQPQNNYKEEERLREGC